VKPLVPHAVPFAERSVADLEAVRAGRASAKHYKAAKAKKAAKAVKAAKRTRRETEDERIQAAMLRVMAAQAGLNAPKETMR
jgi:hypothetical protein